MKQLFFIAIITVASCQQAAPPAPDASLLTTVDINVARSQEATILQQKEHIEQLYGLLAQYRAQDSLLVIIPNSEVVKMHNDIRNYLPTIEAKLDTTITFQLTPEQQAQLNIQNKISLSKERMNLLRWLYDNY